jgi:hypothetical protein
VARAHHAPSAPPASLAERARADEGGAILVMGIFMGACMVGILWYLAGIGDAIVFRERMQEAADATAYSAAVLHARGMNLLVMLNLIMACVLAVRVALKVAYIVLNVLAIALSWVPVVGELLEGAAQGVEAISSAADPAITAALEGLTGVEEVIPHIVPPAAIVGSIQVGMKYAPLIQEAAAGNPVTTVDGLPVEAGDPNVLCFQAGKAVIDILFGVIPGTKKVRKWLEGPFGDLVAAGGNYFCELGSGGAAPDLSGLINGQVDKGCDDKIDQYNKDLDEAKGIYQAACDDYRAACSQNLLPDEQPATLTAAQQTDLNEKQAKVAEKQALVNGFNSDDCKSEAKQKIQGKLDKQSSSSGGGGNIAPRRVIKDWKNGVPNAQMLSVAVGDTKLLNTAPTGVKAGNWNKGNIAIPESAQYALAQAEYFYDCNDVWETKACNGTGGGVDSSELAMWNFRWRARLRRYNSPFQGSVPGLDSISGALNAAVLVKQIGTIDPLNSLSVQNAALLSELGRTLLQDPKNLIIH